MHEGAWSSRLGIPGVPAAAEEVMVGRDIALARDTGAPHPLPPPVDGGIGGAWCGEAKSEGLPVTAEAAPHHFTLTDGCTAGYDPVFKVNPPLRPAADVEAVKAGLADGTIDAIATDHAPHAPELKDLPFDQAPPGMLGLQTALPLALGQTGPAPGPGAGPAQLAAGGHRRARPRTGRRAGWADRAGSRRQSGGHRPRPPSGRSTPAPWPAAAATRPTPGGRLTGQVRHTVFAGEPVVVDAEAQR